MNKKILSIIILAAFMILTNHLHATGMGDFTFDNDGGGSGSAGVPIDGGLSGFGQTLTMDEIRLIIKMGRIKLVLIGIATLSSMTKFKCIHGLRIGAYSGAYVDCCGLRTWVNILEVAGL